MKLKNLFFAAAAVLGVVACQNKPSVAEGVTVDPAEITFAKEGETKEVTITTADEWKLSVPEDLSWLEISDKKGSGTTKITLKAPDNTDGYDRSGNITVKAGMYSARIKISQPGKGEKVDSPIEKLLAQTLDKDQVIEGAVDLKDIQVVAKSKTAGVISDGTAMILVYGSFEAAIGDKGDIKGDLTVYSFRNQIKNAVFTKTGNEGVKYSEPLNLNEVLDTYDWKNSRIRYCEATGTVRYDGSKYYNVFLDGRSKDVSIQYWDGDLATLKDKIVEFSGFFVSGTDHVAVFPVGEIEIKGDAGEELKLEVKAKQTETGFEASWNEVAGADKYSWELQKGETKVDGGDVSENKINKEAELEVGTKYTVVVKALKGAEELISASASFTARDMSQAGDEVELTLDADALAALKDGNADNALDEVITLKNESAYSGAVGELRVYKNKKLTISSSAGDIKSISFTCTKDNPVSGFGTVDGLEVNGNDGTWTGSEQEIVFTASDKQVRVTALTIIYSK